MVVESTDALREAHSAKVVTSSLASTLQILRAQLLEAQAESRSALLGAAAATAERGAALDAAAAAQRHVEHLERLLAETRASQVRPTPWQEASSKKTHFHLLLYRREE